MKGIAYVYPIAALVIFFQAITGAATVLGFYDFATHMLTGYVTGAVALAALGLAFWAKPKDTPLRYSSLVLFALVVIQGELGFAAQSSDPLVVAHFVNALLIFGVSIAMVFYSVRWGRMTSTA
jgi:heme A synthase